jgi:uncharacterized protein
MLSSVKDNHYYKNYNFPKVVLFCLLFHKLSFAQFTIPETNFHKLCFMIMRMFKRNRKAQLEEKLIKYSSSTTTQVIVTIEPSKGDIGILAPNGGQTWGIEQQKMMGSCG